MSQFHFSNKVQPESVISLNLGENTSCVLLKKRVISVRAEPMPVLQPDGVLVKVISTGESARTDPLSPRRPWICGSDMHGYLSGGIGGRPVLEPTVMGHESSGEVIAVGELVTTHTVGDRVAVEPGLPCRRCVNCKDGRGNLCLDGLYCGGPGSIGSLSKYYALPADMAPKIPDNVGWDEAGCIQPLAVGVQIGKRVDLRAHQSVAIFGLGPIGLIAGAVAHAYSASKILGFDINPKRVAFAKQYISPLTGRPIFDHVYLSPAIPVTSLRSRPEGLAEKISEAPNGIMGDADTVEGDDHETPGDMKWEQAVVRVAKWLKEAGLEEEEGVDRVVEASGAEDCGLYGVAIAKQGAIYLAVGLGHGITNIFPTIAVTNKEIDVRGIARYTASCFPSAIDFLRRGVVDVKQLITITFPMSRSKEALETVASGDEIKVIIKNQE